LNLNTQHVLIFIRLQDLQSFNWAADRTCPYRRAGGLGTGTQLFKHKQVTGQFKSTIKRDRMATIDWDEALVQVGNDTDFLKEVLQDLMNECHVSYYLKLIILFYLLYILFIN
jgi:hypothetical protein